ncbi:hypothetical protein [Edaphovirga cremea]|uniref:hypothetical protein n=1 Tax=Edaphovirga cremea TaxID=2267246 RepID=UPI003989FBF9
MIKSMAIVFFIGFSLIIFWGWLIVMPNTTYSDKDTFKYYALTYKEIRNAPRLSSHYYFEYDPGDEASPQSSTMYSCELNNIDESYQRLVSYVMKTGVPLRKGYSLNDVNYKEYFEIVKVKIIYDECLTLSFSKESN